MEDIALGVARAHPDEGVAQRQQQIDGAAKIALVVGQDRRADRDRDRLHGRGRGIARGRGEGLERGQQPARRLAPPRGRQRHHGVGVGEGEHVVVEPAFELLGQLGPAGAQGNPQELQAREQGGGVLDVEVEIRGVRMDRPVVERQRRVVVAALELEQRPVPPQMAAERVAVVPGAVRVVEPGEALLEPALHLQDVGDRVQRPEVLAVELHGLAAGGLRLGVGAAFLVAEGQHAEQVAVAGHGLVPGVEHPGRAAAQLGAAAHPEQREVLQPQAQEVARMVEQNLVPDRAAPVHVAADPGAERGDMGGLPGRDPVAAGRARRIERGLGPAQHRVGAEQHEQIALQAVRHGEVRVRLERLLDPLAGRQAVLEVVVDRRVVVAGGRLATGGQRQPANVGNHAPLPVPAPSVP